MARHKKHQAGEDTDPGLDVSSLIDVCFLLLIYFIVTSTIKPRESDLLMALPGASTESGEAPEIDPMLIWVEGTGTVYVGEGAARQHMDSDMAVRDLPLLSEQLGLYSSAANAANETPLVQIHVVDEAEQQRVIDVLNALAKFEITSVTFTNLSPQE